jgi:FkbM family methyltransferase
MNLKYIRNNTIPSATYVQSDFIAHINDKESIKVIVEAGARDLLDALQLEKIYPNAQIFSFECNPECVDVCKNNLSFSQGRITFFNCAISNKNETLSFYSFDSENCNEHDAGCSSLYEHKNTSNVPMKKIQVSARTLKTILTELGISSVDMLCLDLQGGEYNALLGLEEYISSVKYIVAEFDSNYYKDAPDNNVLLNFLKSNNFIPVYTNHDTLFQKQ